MQLRQNRRLPGRYREEDIPELPPKPTALQPTIPFDPTLPPAAFPTLPLNQSLPEKTQETVSDTTLSSISSISPLNPETEKPPFVVFREDPVITDPSPIEEPDMSEYSEPSEFESWNGEDDPKQLRKGLPVYDNRVDWDDLTDGVKIIVIMELCKFLKFHNAALFIELGDGDLDRFMEMVAGAVDDHEAEFARIVHATTRKINMVKNGHIYQAKEEWDDFIEREIHGEKPYTPIVAFIKKVDIEKGKEFILTFKFREEIPDYNPKCNMGVVPKFDTVQRVVRRLDWYLHTDATENFIRFAIHLLEEYQCAQGYAEGYRDARLDLHDQRTGGRRIQYADQLDIYHALWAGYNRYPNEYEPGVPRQRDAQDGRRSIFTGSPRSVHSYIPGVSSQNPDALPWDLEHKIQAAFEQSERIRRESQMKQSKMNVIDLTTPEGDGESHYEPGLERQPEPESTPCSKRKGTPYPRLMKSIEDEEYDEDEDDSDYEPEPEPAFKKQKTSTPRPATPKPTIVKKKTKAKIPESVSKSLINNMGGQKIFKKAASLPRSRLHYVVSSENVLSSALFRATSESAPNGDATAPIGLPPAPTGGSAAPAGGSTAPTGGSTAPAGGSTAPAGGSTAPAGDSTAPTAPTGGSHSPGGPLTPIGGSLASAVDTEIGVANAS